MRVAALLIGIIGGLIGWCEPAAAAEAPTAPAAPSDWHATVRDFAAKQFKHPAWGYSHSMRDYALARELAAADHVILDDDVLFAAAYLHDMASGLTFRGNGISGKLRGTPRTATRAVRGGHFSKRAVHNC
jgi:hypothetical protein